MVMGNSSSAANTWGTFFRDFPSRKGVHMILRAKGVIFHDPCSRFASKLWFRGVFLRLFQHTFGTHNPKPLPTGYVCRDSGFIVGVAMGCVLGVCVVLVLQCL